MLDSKFEVLKIDSISSVYEKCIKGRKPFILFHNNREVIKASRFDNTILVCKYNTRNTVISSYVRNCYKTNSKVSIFAPKSLHSKVFTILSRFEYSLSRFNIYTT